MKQVAELSEKLDRSSRNSHPPPSSDGPRQRGPLAERDRKVRANAAASVGTADRAGRSYVH